MKSILTMAWTAEDPSAFDLAAKLARTFGARLVGLEPPSYGVMSMAWADAGMGAPICGGRAAGGGGAGVRPACGGPHLGMALGRRQRPDSDRHDRPRL